jgi:hypothetical protein
VLSNDSYVGATSMKKKPAAKGLSKKHHDDIMAALNNQLKMFLHLEKWWRKWQQRSMHCLN